MCRCVILSLALLASLPAQPIGASTTPEPIAQDASKTVSVVGDLASVPLVFVSNLGQWDSEVLFRADAGATTIWLCRDRIVYQSARRVNGEKSAPSTAGRMSATVTPIALSSDQNCPIEQLVVTGHFDGANPDVEVIGKDLLGRTYSYFKGNDPALWRTNVPAYDGVVFKDIYPGVDLSLQGRVSGRARYEYSAVSAQALDQVNLEFGEATETWRNWSESTALISSPETVSATRAGRPISESAASGMAPDAVPLEYSTVLGGSDLDGGNSIKVDNDGAVYIAGYTYSPDFPTQDGYDSDPNGGYDIFVAKLAASGNAFIYSTYLGGSGNDGGYSVAVDGSGCAYVTGFTYSTDFPTLSAYDDSYTGNIDAVAVKLSSDGTALVYSTYLGGAREDRGNCVAVDGSGCAHITGYTSSTNFPLQSQYDGSFNGGYQDVFVAKLAASGNALVYSTYLGSPYDDWGYGIAVDNLGCAYVAGGTPSEEFPVLNGYDMSHNGGEDAFVVKFSAAGSTLVYSTFLGGPSEDDAYGITVDALQCAYVTGITSSPEFPTQVAFDSDNGGSGIDGFVTKLSASGASLAYSSFLGGSQNDWGSSIAVDSLGYAYVVGGTVSSDFPLRNASQTSLNGVNDAFVSRITPTGSALSYSTFLGGSASDWGYGVAVSRSGSACVTGSTYSSDFPTQGGLKAGSVGDYAGAGDVFVTKFGLIVGCCSDRVGDVNNSGVDEPTIGDVSMLIDARFITGDCEGIIQCYAEADINQSGGSDPICDDLTIGDISRLIDYLFITGESLGLANCL